MVNIEEVLTTQPTAITYDKMFCRIWQKTEGKLNLVPTKEKGKLVLLQIADELFECVGPFCGIGAWRLDSISSAEDAIANDVMYHYLCCADAKKK